MSDELITISLCTNDDHGNNTGRVRAMHVHEGGALCELESPYISESDYNRVFPRFHLNATKSRLHVGHFNCAYFGTRDWYGNMFWCAVAILPRDAKALVRYLVETREWQIMSGPVESRFLPKDWAA